MPPQGDREIRQTVRQAIIRARKITAMLQGTMGLEGQGFDPKFLREMKQATVRDLLISRR